MKKNNSEATEPVHGKAESNEHVIRFAANANEMTSIVNGNQVLFIDRGAREITLIKDEEDVK